MASTTTSSGKCAAISFLNFLNKSVTPFHAVQSCEEILQKAGFTEVFEKDYFKVKPGDKCFIKNSSKCSSSKSQFIQNEHELVLEEKQNQSTIFAFAVGGQYQPGGDGNGFSIVVAHTDSPCLRVKPVSKRCSENFLQVAVSPYGGGIWRTWFDRDLSMAGQVVYKPQRQDKILHKLVDLKRPLLNIPNLAIHLESDPAAKFEYNKETHLTPLIGTLSFVDKKKECPKQEKTTKCSALNCSIVEEHHEEMLTAVAQETGCQVDELLDLDLYLYDVQPAALTGLNEEFISGARLDNLVGTYTAIIGLVNSLADSQSLASDSNIRLVACYDNEEVGSNSAQGAASAFSEWLLRRLATPNQPDCETSENCFERAIANSYLISADQAHACHPNYSNKHEDNHKPNFHGGVVVKVNVNQRYATNALTHAILKVIADKAGVPLQKMIVRNDSRCGSTVGPILATGLGLQTVDVGCPQLAMHSIRELADVSSIEQASKLYSEFFKVLPSVLASIESSPTNTN